MSSAISFSKSSMMPIISLPQARSGSFIEHLQSVFSEKHAFETICMQCFGVKAVSREITDVLLVRSQSFLPHDLLLIGHQSSLKDAQSFGYELLSRAEVLRQTGSSEEGRKFEELAVRWLLAPEFLKGWSSTYLGITQNCLSILKEIELKKTELKENYLGINSLVRNIVPKRASTKTIEDYAGDFFSRIQAVLEKKVSKELFDFRLHLNDALDNGFSTVHRKSRIWVHKTYDGVHFIYVPDPVASYPREDSLAETVATEVVISKVHQIAQRFFEPRKLRTLLYEEKTLTELEKERKNHEDILSLPGAEEFFAPLPITYKTMVVKAPGYESFQDDLRFTHSLPVEKFLDVFEGVAKGLEFLESYNYVSGEIKNENIVFKRDDNKVFGLIDHFRNICVVDSRVPSYSSKRFNKLTQNGYASFETHRYALVIAIAEAFFLDLNEDLPTCEKSCERHVLGKLQNLVYDHHCNEIRRLNTEHKGFGREFSQELLKYVSKIARDGEEGLQLLILEQFAFKMAIFPEISALFLKAVKANESHLQLLNSCEDFHQILNAEPKIPNLKQIQEVLQQGKEKLQSICFVKERTKITEVSSNQIEKILKTIFNENEISKDDLRVETLTLIVNDVLKDSPYIGSEERIHKNKLWKDTGLKAPFSLWICVQADVLRLEFFDPNFRQALGEGGNKKVKAGLQVDISLSGDIQYTPIVISRIRKGAFDWSRRLVKGNKMQERILKIPGAEKYFLGISRNHAPHYINHKRKLESTSLRFQSSLNVAIEKNALQVKDSLFYLSKRDFIDFLKTIGAGIRLIRERGISHGDLKTDNIGIFAEDENKRAVVFDNDFSCKFHRRFPEGNYRFWNAIRQQLGFVSAETDLYGYVLILAETLLQNFKTCDRLEKEEERILRFQRIAEEPAQEKKSIQSLIENKILEMCFEISEDMKLFFSNPLEERDVEDVPEAFFDFIKSLSSGSIEAFNLEHAIAELFILNRVFNLLAKTFQADQRSIDKMRNSPGMDPLKALSESGFPTPEEIEEVLRYCEEVVNAIEDRIIT